MIKQLVYFIKKIIFSSFVLYGYNILAVPLGLIIPINMITVLILVVFGYSSLFSLILIQILLY